MLVDITKDAQQAEAPFVWPPKIDLPGYRPVTKAHGKQIQAAAQLLVDAKKPVLYVGGGVIRSRASRELLTLAETTGAPVVTTLMARGAFPDSHSQHLGMPGMHGTVPAVLALQEADLLVSLGARFDDRVTGKAALFAPHAKVVHVDIDPAEIGKIRAADVPIVGDLKDVLVDLEVAFRGQIAGKTVDTDEWWSFLDGLRDEFPLGYSQPTDGLHVAAVRHLADRRADRARGHLRRRRRTAPDVGRAVHQVRATERVAQLRWSGHDGLLGAGGHGRQGRGARPRRVGHRRRRLLPDDQSGARAPARSTTSRSRSPSSTTRRWAWCASGRACSTTVATRTPI